MNRAYYFDNDEDGLSINTSHPVFRQFFADELYYNCFDEEAPFGNDDGSDTLYELQDRLRNRHEVDFADFPRRLIEEEWEMTYLPPEKGQTREQLIGLARQNVDGLPGEQALLTTDQVILATAFGQLKTTGQLDHRLKDLAFLALDRQDAMSRIFWGWPEEGPTEAIAVMRRDLEVFCNKDLEKK